MNTDVLFQRLSYFVVVFLEMRLDFFLWQMFFKFNFKFRFQIFCNLLFHLEIFQIWAKNVLKLFHSFWNSFQDTKNNTTNEIRIKKKFSSRKHKPQYMNMYMKCHRDFHVQGRNYRMAYDIKIVRILS